MNAELRNTAQALVAPGRGILAADESDLTEKFKNIGIESTPESRRQYRELLFTTPGVEQFISGVILFDETIRQTDKDGTPFVQLLAERGIIPGIKVDQGKKQMVDSPMETITIGLEGLEKRLKFYYGLGARFTKWRGVIVIGDEIPSEKCINANAEVLGDFTYLSQNEGFIPVVEPEVVMDGTHTIETCATVTSRVLERVFNELEKRNVDLSAILLKPNMIVPGTKSGQPMDSVQVARATLEVLKQRVPEAVPGIVFLSGGMSPQEATANLNAMNQMDVGPWELSFSYGRALQDPVREAWSGQSINRSVAQEAFLKRARLNSLARFGKYAPEMEQE